MTVNRQTTLLIIMLLFLVGGGFYYFVTLPLKAEQASLSDELRKQQSMLAKLKQAASSKEEQHTVTFPPTYQAMIPEASYLEQIMLDMTQVETVSGAQMDGIGLSTSEDKEQKNSDNKQGATFIPIGPNGEEAQADPYPGLQRVSISTKLTGTYEQIYRFFEEVQSLPRVIRVEQAKISGTSSAFFLRFNPQEASQKEINVEVTMSAYYAPLLKPYFSKELPVITPPPATRTNPFY